MIRRPEDSPDRFVFGWLPAIAWLITFAIYSVMSIQLAVSTSRRVDAPWSSWLFIAILGVVALFSLRVTVRASRDARAMSARSGQDDPWPATMPLTAGQAIERPQRQAERGAAVPPIEAPAQWPTDHEPQALAPRLGDVPVSAVVDEAVDVPVPSSLDQPVSQRAAQPADAEADRVGDAPRESLEEEDLPSMDAAAQQRLADMLLALEAAGILEPGEVPLDVALEAAELAGDFDGFGLDELLVVLDTVEVERSGGFEHLVLYPTQGEVFDQQVVRVVEDAVRLAGRLDGLGAVELEGIGDEAVRAAPQGADGPTNAVVHFALDGRWHSIPFMMFPEGFPLGLIEGLAEILAPEHDGRVFVEAWSDALVAISCIDRDRLADLDAALAWDGETFGMVAPASIDELEPSPEVSDSVAVRPG